MFQNIVLKVFAGLVQSGPLRFICGGIDVKTGGFCSCGPWEAVR